MKNPRFVAYAIVVPVALVLVGGCGNGSQSQSALPAPSFTGVRFTHPAKAKSWMTKGAVSDNLLYLADTASTTVDVYSWPFFKKVGELAGSPTKTLHADEGSRGVIVSEGKK